MTEKTTEKTRLPCTNSAVKNSDGQMPAVVAGKLRCINILIKRHIEKSESKEALDNATGTHGYIVCYLKEHEGTDIFQRDIENRFSIRRSTATAILQLMEKNGLIVRTAVEHDARLKKICLTDKAKQLYDIMDRDRVMLENRLIEGFSEQEKAQLISLLDRVKTNLSNWEEENNAK